MSTQANPDNSARDSSSSSRGGGLRLIAGGMSVLMALALAVNLTCRAATPVGTSGGPEKTTLRQLTLAIHRVVRRLIRSRSQHERPRVELRSPRYGLRLRRWSVISPASGLWHKAGGLLEHLINLPPPALA